MSDHDDTLGRADQVDPLPSLRTLYRAGETDSARAVLLRTRWLRREQPEANVATELAHLDDRLVVVKATVTLPTGAAASGLAAATLDPDGDRSPAVARAETQALGAALDRLGYALAATPGQAAEAAPAPAADRDEQDSPAPDGAPAELPEPASGRWSATPREPEPSDGGDRPQVVDTLRRMRRPEQPDVPGQAPTQAPATLDRATPATRLDSRRPPITLRPRGQGQSTPAPTPTAATEDDAPLEDFSWSAFWKWARQRGYTSHDDLARAIGRPTQGLTPGEIRTALRETGVSD